MSLAAGARPLAGLVLMVITTACFALMDTTVKLLIAVAPVLVVLWARYAVQAVAMGAWFAGTRRLGLLRAAHPRFQLLRGALLLLTSALGYLGLREMPVAEFTAVVMLAPVIVTVLAWLLYREPVTRWHLAAVVGGFAGALIVLRPGAGLFGWAALFPVLAALCYAAFQLLTRRLAGAEHPLTTHFYTGLVGMVACTAALLTMPQGTLEALRRLYAADTALLLAVGALGTTGHLMLILAFGMAGITLLMPLIYLQIFFAALAGWVVFRHAPDLWAWIGMAVVAGCGALAVWLNTRGSPAHRPVPDSVVAADTMLD